MQKKKIILIVLSTLIISVGYGIIYLKIKSGTPFNSDFFMVVTIIIAQILVLGGLGLFMFRHVPHYSNIELKKRLLPKFILFVTLSLLISLCLQGIILYVFAVYSGKMVPDFMGHLLKEIFPAIIRQFGIWILVVAAFFFYSNWNEGIKREMKLNEEYLKFKYQRLKSQLSPHFFFNSLNTLSELIYEDTRRADNFVQALSKMYRYILENEETAFIALEKELAFVETYVILQKERDKDKVWLETNVPKPAQYSIVPLSVQLLVENALKHNARSLDKPLIINIFIENDYIVVSNAMQKKNKIGHTTRVGLQNLSERIKMTMNKDLVISNENNIFTVKIPLLCVQK
jgi:two-component system, LytTR family, sensor kinase